MLTRCGPSSPSVYCSIGRHYAEAISDLHSVSIQLATRPETSPAYNLRLYPISLERGALLHSIELQERHALSIVQTAYDEERERVEEEWKRGRDRIRERMLEGIEDRRRRAREEKDGEGTVVGEHPFLPPSPPSRRSSVHPCIMGANLNPVAGMSPRVQTEA